MNSKTMVAIAAATLLAQASQAEPLPLNPPAAGFDAVILYMADGEYLMSAPHPEIPGCLLSQCDGEYFWSQIAGVPADEVALLEQEAKDVLLQRFGLDVDTLVGNGALTWRDIYADPRVNYRARYVSGERVHRLGWEVHDQAFMALTTQEMVLGGEFEGVVAPAGTGFPVGRYWIQKSRLVAGENGPQIEALDEFIKITYKTAGPLPPPDIHGLMSSTCEITDSPWGTGVATVVAAFDFTADPAEVPIKQNIRNTLTFDGADGLGRYPGVHN